VAWLESRGATSRWAHKEEEKEDEGEGEEESLAVVVAWVTNKGWVLSTGRWEEIVGNISAQGLCARCRAGWLSYLERDRRSMTRRWRFFFFLKGYGRRRRGGKSSRLTNNKGCTLSPPNSSNSEKICRNYYLFSLPLGYPNPQHSNATPAEVRAKPR